MINNENLDTQQKPSEEVRPPIDNFNLIFKIVALVLLGAIALGFLMKTVNKANSVNQEVAAERAWKVMTAEARNHCLKSAMVESDLGYRCERCQIYDEYFLNKYCIKREEIYGESVLFYSPNCNDFKMPHSNYRLARPGCLSDKAY